jgi:hypothetical protein
MPIYPDEALAAAERAIGASLGRGEPSSAIAKRALDAAVPLLAEAVAGKIAEHAQHPRDPSHVPTAWDRHFGIAARIAAGAFTTEAESKQQAAQALAAGHFVRCDIPEDGEP